MTAFVGGREALMVFAFEGEAEMYLTLRGDEAGWRVRETTRGELISILHGPCARAERVALDPPPEVCRRMFALFDGVDRQAFLLTLTQEEPTVNPVPERGDGRAMGDGDRRGGGAEISAGGRKRAAAPGDALGETVR